MGGTGSARGSALARQLRGVAGAAHPAVRVPSPTFGGRPGADGPAAAWTLNRSPGPVLPPCQRAGASAKIAEMDPKRLVADGYDRIHERYALWGDGGHDLGRRAIDDALRRRLVPSAGRVVDLGCGTGAHATDYLAERFSVVGVDISRCGVAAARLRLPGAHFVVADMATVQFRPASFDLVTAFFSLIHVPRDEHAQVLDNIRSWLRPRAVAILVMGAGRGGEGVEPDWLGAPMYWSNWDRDTNLKLVADARLELVEARDEVLVEHGKGVPFLLVLARRM